MKLADIIENKLNEALSPIILKVENVSKMHKGHTEAGDSGESHFTVTVVAPCFTGMPLVKRHQKIYAILNEEMRGKIHALALKTFAPEEYQH